MQTTECLARQIIDERERRRWFFPQGSFGEAAWEMLLLLYSSDDREQSLQALCNGTLTPCSNANRWLSYLETEGLITKHDAREGNPRVRLTSKASHALDRYLTERLQRAGAKRDGLHIDSRARTQFSRIIILLTGGVAIASSGLTYLLAC